MNKKIILLLAVVLLFIFLVVSSILRYRSQIVPFAETVPLLPTKTIAPTSRPESIITRPPAIPQQVNLKTVSQTIADNISSDEKNKIFDSLPVRVESFTTSIGINTTINIYSLSHDPSPVLRLEIYGINYNLSGITGPNAIAFRDSFLEAKRLLAPSGIVLKNVQIVYGNRQYIQDTANYWVKTFKLLD